MMRRFYQQLVADHLKQHRQMLFLMGPRQVGKTTLAQTLDDEFPQTDYFSWNNPKARTDLLKGPDDIATLTGIERPRKDKPLLIFDEIHKYGKWKLFLKGLYDTYPDLAHIVVTGSARLDVYQRGADSLMGRYFPFRIHPFSVGELLHPHDIPKGVRAEPKDLQEDLFDALWRFGGFPDPFLKAEAEFCSRWRRGRFRQLFREDLRDLSRVKELGQIEVLAELLRHGIGQPTSYTSLGNKVQVSSKTLRNWLKWLDALYYCFEVRPWSRNLSRSLLKEPKLYLWDWSLADNEGQRAENLIASHLLKSIHFWTDYGVGEFGLYYLRTKDKREVDFVVVRDGKPWFLVEVKKRNANRPSAHLKYFQQQLGAPHAFHVVLDLPYEEIDCFSYNTPVVVPARTFLSQLV